MVACFLVGVVVDGVFRGASWFGGYVEALTSWLRLHTVLRGHAFDIQRLLAWNDVPVTITSAGMHADAMAVFGAAWFAVRRVARPRA